jgi:prenylcysteine oxidase/farnesylcysteine lyase
MGAILKWKAAKLSLGLLVLLGVVADAQRIAVIGGGISGSFAAKYLADYNKDECMLDSITIYEPMPVTKAVTPQDVPVDNWQGSRVSSLRLKDGTLVELGASVAYKGFHLVLDMMRGDPSIEIGSPFSTGAEKEDAGLHTGLGVYNGDGEWPLLTSNASGFLKKLKLLYRYNFELINMGRVSKQSQEAFSEIPKLLDSQHPDTFFDSPSAIWDAVGLLNAVHSSYDQLLDVIGLKTELSWWRKLLPFQGSLRNELLVAINLVNYNQDNSQVNAIVGLGSFAASAGGLFSISGGNQQLIESAIKQATATSNQHCQQPLVDEVAKRITTVVGSLEGFTLYAGTELLGTFDIVVLAAPLQHSRIEFMVQSHFDESVLHAMPLGGLVDTEEHVAEDGHTVFPHTLPESALRSYTQVVTTVVSNATLAADYWSLPDKSLPMSICMTPAGKLSLHNITAITEITSSGVYKVFSDNRLDESVLTELFGSHHEVEYVKVWGGPHGGATPDYQGQGTSTNFLLYDGAAGLGGHTSSGALYYTNTMEQSSLSCLELSAVGAKAVAKLVAQRVGLISQKREEVARDEL